jgi:hypothetical protein
MLGVEDGITVGLLLGLSEGTELIRAVGTTLGIELGFDEGNGLGCTVGMPLGN